MGRENPAPTGVARGSTLNLLGAVCQQVALFATTMLVARVLGAQDLGRYALGFALLAVISLLSLCGFRAALTRYVAVQLADRDPAAVRGTIRLCMSVSIGVSVVLAAGLALASGQLADLFNDPTFANDIILVALVLPAATIRDTSLAATQGWRSQKAFTLIGWVYEPLARLALTALALIAGFGLTGAFVAILVAGWTSALAAVWALRGRLRALPTAPRRFETRAIFSFSMVSWATTLASSGLIWADTLLLGHLSSTESVGVYNVSTRLVTLAVFVMAPINAAVAPQFAHLFHRGEGDALGRLYATSTTLIVRLSLPAFVLLAVFPRGLLGIFGPDYMRGATVTLILAVGQLVSAATGPCGTLLNMSGRVSLNLANNVVILVLNVVLNLFLIPRWGIIGAAVAWSVSLSLVNVLRVAQVHHLLGAVPFGRSALKAGVAAAAAATAAAALRLAVGQESTVAWVAGGVVICLVYGCVSWFLGFDRDERASWEEIVRRRRVEKDPATTPQS